MIFEDISNPKSVAGYRLKAYDFDKKDFKNLKWLIENLGFSRDKKTERKIKELVWIGIKRTESLSNLQIFFKKIKNKIVSLKYTRFTERIYSKGNEKFSFSYIPKTKFLTAIFQSKELNNEEFISLIMSNKRRW